LARSLSRCELLLENWFWWILSRFNEDWVLVVGLGLGEVELEAFLGVCVFDYCCWWWRKIERLISGCGSRHCDFVA